MNIKICLIVFLSALGLSIIGAIIGNILESNGTLSTETIGFKGINAVTLVYFALFCVMLFQSSRWLYDFLSPCRSKSAMEIFSSSNGFRSKNRQSSTVSGASWS
jgi:hypothetical protein